MKGGKLIGNGNYGCVFDPPLQCNDDKVNDNDSVGKVFFKDSEYNDEIKEMNKVMELDPKHTFTIPVINNCKVKANDALAFKSDKCDINVNSIQIIYPNGGNDLNKVQNMNIDILYSFLNIIKGLRVMHIKNYIHGDIKPGNILYHEVKNELKLIDFGFASIADTVFKENSTIFNIMNAQYPYFPPEYFWFMYNTKVGKHPDDALLKEHFSKTFSGIYALLDFKAYNIHVESSLSKLCSIMNDLKILESRSWQVIACKADVYGLGIALMEVVNKIDDDLKNKSILFMVRSVITHMIEPCVFDRWDINQVYVAWKEIVSFK